jgi:hypothetical protein
MVDQSVCLFLFSYSLHFSIYQFPLLFISLFLHLFIRDRSFFRKPFFRKFVLAPPPEVLGDERRNEGYAPTS